MKARIIKNIFDNKPKTDFPLETGIYKLAGKKCPKRRGKCKNDTKI